MWYSYSKKMDGDGSLFIATWLPERIQQMFHHISGLDDDLHMTVLYIEEGIDSAEDRQMVLDITKKICERFPPLSCKLTEIGIMGNNDNSLVANVTVMDGARFYSELLGEIEAGLEKDLKRKYDFLPHVTFKIKNRNQTANIKDLKKPSWLAREITVQFSPEDDKKFFKLKG